MVPLTYTLYITLSFFAIIGIFIFREQPIGIAFFGMISALLLVWYIYLAKIKKIIHEKDYFIKCGLFGKRKYLVNDITKVVVYPMFTKGITIYFKNGKINLNPFYTNYEKILENIIDW